MQPVLEAKNLNKSFTLHNQGKTSFIVFKNINLNVYAGECIVLHGESGQGKSTLLRCLYANYLSDSGAINFNSVQGSLDLNQLSDREIIRLRQANIAYVSQFLRVIPRISTLEIVKQPMLELGYDNDEADQRARGLLNRLHIPQHLWPLSPTTFSGGEQQRVNIAREFTVHRPLMLLDEPTASLDAQNRETVIELILEAKQQDSAIIGIFHDELSRKRVADRIFDMKTGTYHD